MFPKVASFAKALNSHFSLAKKPVSEDRLRDAVDTLLSLQNSSGGFASYEKIRAPHLLELINPAEVFGKLFLVLMVLQICP